MSPYAWTMGRAPLPEARIEPRGVSGRLEQLGAEARQRARAAGRVGVLLARVLGATAAVACSIAMLVWLAPQPRSPQLDELERMQRDFHRSQQQMEQLRHNVEAMQRLHPPPMYQVQPGSSSLPPPPPLQ